MRCAAFDFFGARCRAIVRRKARIAHYETLFLKHWPFAWQHCRDALCLTAHYGALFTCAQWLCMGALWRFFDPRAVALCLCERCGAGPIHALSGQERLSALLERENSITHRADVARPPGAISSAMSVQLRKQRCMKPTRRCCFPQFQMERAFRHHQVRRR